MPATYSQILLHIVFSTKHRTPWLTTETTERLYPYLGGLIRKEGGTLYEVGGAPDHVHAYVRWRPDASVSGLLRAIKARASLWIRQEFPKLGQFAWQRGYSVFSVSASQEGAVRRYIARQAEHHATVSFETELRQLLERHGVEFDERYMFD